MEEPAREGEGKVESDDELPGVLLGEGHDGGHGILPAEAGRHGEEASRASAGEGEAAVRAGVSGPVDGDGLHSVIEPQGSSDDTVRVPSRARLFEGRRRRPPGEKGPLENGEARKDSMRPTRRTLRTRWRRLAAVMGAAATGMAGVALSGAAAPASRQAARAPVGIVDASGVEQAPILAEMKGAHAVGLDGFRFWVGTIDRRPVVDVAGGSSDEASELATYVLDTHFHPRAVLFSGVAASTNATVHVGDVVLGAFVVDKSAVHYRLGGYSSGYRGEEVALTTASDVSGDLVTGFGETLPTPKDAAKYGRGPGTPNRHEVFVQAYAASAWLLDEAEKATLGTTTIAHATGDAARKGRIKSKVVAGVIGQADVWTEPLTWVEAQNMLYPSDAEESEASGFAYANAEAGVPSLVVRGIGTTVWYPRANDPLVGADHAAVVVRDVVAAMPPSVPSKPATFAGLWPGSNAARLGYLVAKAATYYVSDVPRVVYVSRAGKTLTLAGKRLQSDEREYTYAAGAIR